MVVKKEEWNGRMGEGETINAERLIDLETKLEKKCI
jgi:hypothetical protein